VKTVQAAMEPPTVIIVGEVVKLREQLNWFEKRPLFGKRIVVTRAREQAGEFARLLAAYGAEIVTAPAIKLVPPPSWEALDEAIARLSGYSWLMFTSVNGVAPFMERLKKARKDVRSLSHLLIGAIGPRTAEELARHGLAADLIPTEFQAEGMVAAMSRQELQGAKILIPRAEVARELLPEQLREQGAVVDVVPVYRTVLPEGGVSRLKEQLLAGGIDVVTFASSSTVSNFVELMGGPEEARRLAARTIVACIGPITGRTAEAHGLPVAIMPGENTIPALAQAIVRFYGEAARVAVPASR
jgi:uroporphyrinogen III methyltransferase / synthase